MVQLRGESRIADSRPGTVHTKGTSARGVWGHAPRTFLNFRSSEIDFGAFWDDFPAWQGTRTNCNHCCKPVTLYAHAEQSIELHPNVDLIILPAP